MSQGSNRNVLNRNRPGQSVNYLGDRRPPYSEEAEQSVLGAVMLEGSAIDIAQSIIPSQECFYMEAHRRIYSTAIDLHRIGAPVDVVTLNIELRKREQLAHIGGAHYLSELNRRTPTAASVGHHARIVVEAWMKRDAIRVATELIAAAYEPGSDAFAVVNRGSAEMHRLCERRVGGVRMLKDILPELVDRIADLSAVKQGEIVGIPTGLYDLDKLIGGLQPTNLYFVGARPGMGKTGHALGIAHKAAKAGYPVGFVSLEMDALQLAGRVTASQSNVNTLKMTTGGFQEREIAQLLSGISALSELPIYIDDIPAQNIYDISAKVRLWVRKYQVKLLIVDYLTLVEVDGEETRARAVEQVCRQLKNLAKELKIAIVALCQLNREVEKRSDKKPQLSDLKDSGGVEECGDAVWFIYRPEHYGITEDDKQRPTQGIAYLLLEKNRHGPSGKEIRAGYQSEYIRFYNLIERDELPMQPHREPSYGEPF
jgi:replicative DNA helicase